MFLLEDQDRLLLESGVSLVSPEKYVGILLDPALDPDKFRVLFEDNEEEEDRYGIKAFEFKTGRHVVFDETRDFPETGPRDHDHCPDEEIARLVEASERFKGTEEELDRLEHELGFFRESGTLWAVLETYKVIQRFREAGVIWGVGRGSGCASYLFYVLSITDVDPLKYDIPFGELSKE